MQARVSTDIFHDGLRRETCSDVQITLAQFAIRLAVHSAHFANVLKGILRCGMILNIIIIIMIIITLFQEDNVFGTNASLTYGPQVQRHACV